jgi:hypothetical protein
MNDGTAVTSLRDLAGAESVDSVREQIAETRSDLGKTVEALAAKADVKQRTKRKVDDLKRKASAAAPESGKESVERVAGRVRDQPAIPIALAALLVGFLIGRSITRSR